jgi:hypothetical protein
MGLPIWILQKKLAITFGCHQTINQSFSFQFCEVIIQKRTVEPNLAKGHNGQVKKN